MSSSAEKVGGGCQVGEVSHELVRGGVGARGGGPLRVPREEREAREEVPVEDREGRLDALGAAALRLHGAERRGVEPRGVRAREHEFLLERAQPREGLLVDRRDPSERTVRGSVHEPEPLRFVREPLRKGAAHGRAEVGDALRQQLPLPRLARVGRICKDPRVPNGVEDDNVERRLVHHEFRDGHSHRRKVLSELLEEVVVCSVTPVQEAHSVLHVAADDVGFDDVEGRRVERRVEEGFLHVLRVRSPLAHLASVPNLHVDLGPRRDEEMLLHHGHG
mmetsp:Transcript_20113/g.65504  ORF Transcript_20113/g.65504 Transcript_20113/m.65504 type:complete len:277 (+) Transcript_20113:510-1340(+)